MGVVYKGTNLLLIGRWMNQKLLIVALALIALAGGGYLVLMEALPEGASNGEETQGISISDAHAHLFDDSQFIDELIIEMNKKQIRKTVLFGSADQDYTNNSTYVGGIRDEYNQKILEACDKYPDKLFPILSGFNPQSENSVGYVENQLNTGKWKGIGEIYMIQESLQNYKTVADHPVMLQIYQVLAEFNAPIFFHYERWMQEDVDALYEVIEQNPEVEFVWVHFAHINDLDELENALGRYPNLYISWEGPVSQTILLEKSRGHIETFEKYVNLFDKYPDRFMIGTDVGCMEEFLTPTLNLPYENVMAIHRELLSELSPQTAERIAYKNLEELIG